MGLFKKDAYDEFVEKGLKRIKEDKKRSDREILEESGRSREEWITYYNSLKSLRKKITDIIKKSGGSIKNTELKKALEAVTDVREKELYEVAVCRLVEAGVLVKRKDGRSVVYSLIK